MLECLHGPALLVGDWNAPAGSFEPIRLLQEQFGYRDVAALCAEREGIVPPPTCKGATRHSFIFASPDTIRFVRSCWVGAHFDLDTHSVLFAQFAFPKGNPAVLKWIAPASLDTADVDVEAASENTQGITETLFECVADSLEKDDLDTAIAVWSECVETHLLAHASPSLPVKRYKGRCQRSEPRSVRLAPPRLKGGRPTDFSPSVYVATVQVRQWTKQVRRLRCLHRACVAIVEGRGRSGLLNDRFRLWDSCIRARGFEQGFLVWVAQFGFSTPVALPDVSWMLGVLSVLEDQTQALARRTASDKSGHFMGVLEDSWAAGGSLPFRLMRESQAPEVLELQMKVMVKLAPQKWLPCGKAWLKLLNAEDFRPGDELVGDCCLQVVAVQAPYISVSQAISRRTAASLSKSWIEADPSVWSQHVFDQWNVFWQRDAETAMPPGSQAYVDMVPQVPAAPLVPLDFPLWTRVLKSSKPTSMRGVDGWSFAELRLIPQGFVEVLLQLFHWCERTCSWPRVFQTWLVVLLRKVPTGIVSWGSVRPISVAATLYRMWSKMRTTQLMAHARTLATSTVRPCLATRSIWGMQVEIIAEYLANSITPCGLVLDLIKAFNVVCRPFLKALMLRLGFQPTIVDAWFSCLEGLSRQALVAGAVYTVPPRPPLVFLKETYQRRWDVCSLLSLS